MMDDERRTQDSLAEEGMYNLARVSGAPVTQRRLSARLPIQVTHITVTKREGKWRLSPSAKQITELKVPFPPAFTPLGVDN